MASLVIDREEGASTICLTMIVKNEAAVILRCLRSVRPIITHWCIVDTGSTDDTMNMIREEMKDLPGQLHERPWRNFEVNKTEAIELARGLAEYDVFMDADDILQIPKGYTVPRLTLDCYDLSVDYNGLLYPRPHIFRSDRGFHYKSVLHEYLNGPPGGHTKGRLEGLVYKVVGGGARGRSDTVMKFKNDAETLKEGLKGEPNNERYVFYLAQSYKDVATELLGRGGTPDQRERDKEEAQFYMQKAIKTYERRAKMGSFYQEVFISYLEIGHLSEKVEASEQFITGAYLRAYQYLPQRGAEPLYALARYWRLKDRFALGYMYAKAGIDIEMPLDGQFMDRSVYDWRVMDECSISAYYINRFAEARDLCLRIMAKGIVHDPDLARVKENLRFSLEKLGAARAVPQAPMVVHPPPSAPEASGGEPPSGPTGPTGPTAQRIIVREVRP